MFRLALTLAAMGAFVATAGAQPVRQLPNAPGVMPGSPWGPGMPFVPPTYATPRTPGAVYFPVALPWGWGYGYGYPTYSPWTGWGYGYGGILPPVTAITVQPVVTVGPQARPTPTTVALAREFPATLTLQFPASAEVWLDGKKVNGAAVEERVLTSPVLRAGESYTFDVKARWTSKGKTYETKRSVTLGSGDRSRLLIVSGDEVRE